MAANIFVICILHLNEIKTKTYEMETLEKRKNYLFAIKMALIWVKTSSKPFTNKRSLFAPHNQSINQAVENEGLSTIFIMQ